MKLLVVSNMYPGRHRPDFGVFVSDRVEAYRRAGVPVRVVANSNPRKGRSVVLKYLRLLVRAAWVALWWRPDVVESHYLHPTGFIGAIAARAGNAELVLHAHGSDVFDAPPPGRLESWAVASSAEIHANSDATSDAVRLRHPAADVVTIPPGVDLRSFPPSFDPRPAVVGFVGTMADYKGVDVLVDALAQMPGDWKARLAGGGPLAAAVGGQVGELELTDRVALLGLVDRSRLASFYHHVAVLAVPSRREAFGQVAVEALASGTPVVVTDVGGVASIPNPSCGTVVPSDNAPALAEALSAWIDRRSDEEPKRAAVDRAAYFDIDRQASAALDRYRRLFAVH